jgi:tetratricopeptide (TPR) repeat protein
MEVTVATTQLATREIARNHYPRLEHLWKWREATEKPTAFEYVHLPDDGQEFLKPTAEMLTRELQDAPEESRSRAIIHFKMGDKAFAEWRYKDAASAYLASGAAAQSLSAHLACGVAKIMVSELRAAVELFEAGRVRSQKRQLTRFEAAFGINLGQAYSDLGEMERARRALEMAHALSRKMEDASLEMLSLVRRGLCCFIRGEYEKGIGHCDCALEIARMEKDPIARARALFARGALLMARGKFKEAEENLRAGMDESKQVERSYIAARLHTQLASLYLLQGKGAMAADTAERALEISRRLTHAQGEAKSLALLAIIYLATDQKTRAIESFRQSVESDRRTDYRRGVARSSLEWAKMLLQQRKWDEVRGLLRQVKELAETTGHRMMFLDSASMLAMLSMDSRENERMGQLKKYMETCRSAGLSGLEIMVLQYMGSAWASVGQFDAAEEHYRMALKRCQQIGAHFDPQFPGGTSDISSFSICT